MPLGDPEPELVSAPLARFCTRCGASLASGAIQCACFSEQRETGASLDQKQYSSDLKAVRSAMWLYFTLLLVSLSFAIWARANDGTWSVSADLISSSVSTAVVAFWSFAALRVVIEPLRARFNLAWLLAAMLLATPTYVAAHFTVEWLVALGIQDVNYLLIFQEEGYGLGWAVLLVCVQPAIVEEVAFRGVVQGSLNGVLGSRQALWVSALMFAILHLSIPSLPHLLALGLVLGWFRNRTNSLVPGMFLHFTHNLLVILHEAGEIPWV